MRSSTTVRSVRDGWRPSRRHLIRGRSPSLTRVAHRRWAGLSWRTSIALFAVPLLLAVATGIYHWVAADSTIMVKVTDGFTDAPIAGASVEVGGRAWRTNDRGEVAIEQDGDPLPVTVRHDRYEPSSWVIGDDVGESVSVDLRPTTLEGRLVDEKSGAPIAGATVSVVTDAGPSPSSVSTGADGTYRLTDVPAGGRLRIDAGDYGTREEPIGERTRLDLALPLSVVTGVVRDESGAPVGGALVSGPGGTPNTRTKGDGSYRLVGGAGLGELLVSAPGFADLRFAIAGESPSDATLTREQIKAVYANYGTMGEPERFDRLIEIADQTEINAIVIDVKQDTIYYDTQVPFFREIPGMVNPAFDMAELLQRLDEHNIYAIARMVVFKDPVVAEGRPDLAVQDEIAGGLWRDDNGAAWVNAFEQELWRANADLGAELANLGFDEVQYDYIRFPSDGDLRTADFGNDYSEEARRAAITGAVAMGADAVRGAGARFAIDLFPIIAIYGNDQGIGQTLQDLMPLVDFVNLMIYPSHFEEGNIPVDGHPNDYPAETVTFTLEKGEELVPGTRRKMRPWLQDFTYPLEGFSAYGPTEVRAQIDAAEAFGTSGWMLWNAAGEFEVDALAPE